MSALGPGYGVGAPAAAQQQPDLSRCIADVHAAIQSEPEPEDKAKLAQALMLLQAVQMKNQGEGGAPAAQPNPMQRLSGGPQLARAAVGQRPPFGGF
jgi:hypothetical protein